MKNEKGRNSSIELLRILAIMGVVVLHYNNAGIGGGFKYVIDGTINQYYLFFSENLFVCAVDLFVMISAYYLSCTKERHMIKIVELVLQVIAFRFARLFLFAIMGIEEITIKSFFECFLPVNYFVILYSVLYLLSPYLNVLIEKLSKRDLRRLLILLLVLFSIWTIVVDVLANITGESMMGLSTIGMYGSQNGYSIVNFILIYFVGAYIRINEVKIKKKTALMLALAILLIQNLWSCMEHICGMEGFVAWHYNNPMLIALSAVVLLFFMNFNFSNKVINEFAKGTFTCFLFHGCMITIVGIEKYVNAPIGVLILHQFGVAVGLYLISYVVYKVYSLCTKWFIKLIAPVVNKLNISIE